MMTIFEFALEHFFQLNISSLRVHQNVWRYFGPQTISSDSRRTENLVKSKDENTIGL